MVMQLNNLQQAIRQYHLNHLNGPLLLNYQMGDLFQEGESPQYGLLNQIHEFFPKLGARVLSDRPDLNMGQLSQIINQYLFSQNNVVRAIAWPIFREYVSIYCPLRPIAGQPLHII